jgi:hypothetical protein
MRFIGMPLSQNRAVETTTPAVSISSSDNIELLASIFSIEKKLPGSYASRFSLSASRSPVTMPLPRQYPGFPRSLKGSADAAIDAPSMRGIYAATWDCVDKRRRSADRTPVFALKENFGKVAHAVPANLILGLNGDILTVAAP